MQKKACFAGSKLIRKWEPTDRSLRLSLQNTVELLKNGGEFALRAMKRSMNFGSNFRCREEEDQAPPPRSCRLRQAAPRTLTQIGPGRCRVGEFRIAVRELGVVAATPRYRVRCINTATKRIFSCSDQRNVRPGHRFPTEAWLEQDFV
jgi:hypothetical protein